ncbi:MAG: VanW family protein [Candidatus Peregrinibacteria bacterium]|nr:VanW family protein [Candidatus Peregrinibacteria bacterium]MCB9808028.1 VanW family protein [Candidatus Peribacteria bacterium]
MKNLFHSGVYSIFFLSSFLFPLSSFAYYPDILYRHEHHLFSLNPNQYPSWRKTEEVWTYNGREIIPPASVRIDGDTLPPLPEGMTRSIRSVWDPAAISATIYERIATVLNRPRGEVTIRKDGDTIVFEGVGFLGKTVDTDRAAQLTIDALETGVYDIHLPVTVQQPVMHVLSTELQDMDIQEVIAIGESDFSGSPLARQHNIKTGLEKFNGYLLPKGETFSFNTILGPVNGSTGYKKELVILGDKTLPDYGGGLCQVSTTAYRGAWEYGFPIVTRRNHSFAVSYYSPQGTDATIYPPHTDMQFVNDGPSAILVQTYVEGMKAYYIYYGMRDTRTVEIVGPYVWDKKSPPPDKVEYTTDLPPGETKKVGKAVPGLQAAWFRILIEEDGSETIEPYYSYYEARPNFTQIGVENIPDEPPEHIEATPVPVPTPVPSYRKSPRRS